MRSMTDEGAVGRRLPATRGRQASPSSDRLRRPPSPPEGRRASQSYFLPGGVVKGELPTDTAGLGFSALGLRVSLLLLT